MLLQLVVPVGCWLLFGVPLQLVLGAQTSRVQEMRVRWPDATFDDVWRHKCSQEMS